MENLSLILDLRKLNVGRIGLIIASIFMLVGQFFLVWAGTDPGGPFDGIIQLFPWIIVCTILLSSYWTSEKIGLGLLSAAVAMMLNLALNFLSAIPLVYGNTRVVWTSNAPAYLEVGFSKAQLIQIGTGKNPLIFLSDLLLWVGAILTAIFVMYVFLGVRRFLNGPTRKSSFSIDIGVLLSLLVIAVAVEFYFKYSLFGSYTINSVSYLLMTYLPLLLWLSFTLRRRGVVSIGSASGLVVAVALVPLAMEMLSLIAGGSNASYVTKDGNIAGSGQLAYDILNPIGVFSSVVAISLLLLCAVLWWNYGIYSHEEYIDRDLATVSSEINSLSVISFTLSWIPVTAIPANILGHMAYDQVLNSPHPERGIGLSRAAIVLSYISMFAGSYVVYLIWFS